MRDAILRERLLRASCIALSLDRRWLSSTKNLVSPFEVPERSVFDWLSMSCHEEMMLAFSSSALRVSRRDDLNSLYLMVSMTTLSVASD